MDASLTPEVVSTNTTTRRQHVTLRIGAVAQPEWLTDEAIVEFERLYVEACSEITAIMERYTLRPLVEEQQHHAPPPPPPPRVPQCLLGFWRLAHALTTCVVHSRHVCPLDAEAARIASAAFCAGTLVSSRASAWADACFRCIKADELNDQQTSELESYLDQRTEATVKAATTHFQDCYKSYCPANEKTTQ